MHLSAEIIKKLVFYNGRNHYIDKDRVFKFEMAAVINRYYSGRQIDSTTLIEDLGPIQLDFTDVHPWAPQIPDINEKSARLFTLWAEDGETKDVVLILRGIYVLLPFKWGENTLLDYYEFVEDIPYYPIAVISSFRTTFRDEIMILRLVDRVKEEIELVWRDLRQSVIDRLEKGSELWKRYVLCFEKIIHFSFLCPSIDRELIDALRMKNYRTTGVMQLLASPELSYDQAMINSHLTEAKALISQTEDNKNS
ncbi:MAG: hypothetical protein ACFFE8_03075 [Candidatus Heimdallarchaeota archaeon]